MELYDLTIPRHDKWAAIERRGVMSYCARGIAWVTVFFIALTALFLVYGMVMVQAPYLNAYSNPFTQMLRAVDLFPMIRIIIYAAAIGLVFGCWVTLYMWFHYKRLYQKGEGNWRTEHPAHYVIAMGKPVYVGLVSPLFLGIMTLVLYSYYINEFSFGQNALILAIWYIFLGVIIGVSFALIKWAAACRSLNLSNPSMRIWPIYLSFAIVFGHVLYSVWMIS